MTILVLICGAAGVVLFVSGLPFLRREDVAGQVEPFLPGSPATGSFLAVGTQTGRLGRAVARLLPDGDRRLAERMRAAGIGGTPDAFRVEQMTWGAVGVLVVAAMGSLAFAVGVAMDMRAWPVLAAIAATGGVLGRDWFLTRQVEIRRAAQVEEIPMAIDLLTLSIMSGEAIPPALARVGAALSGGIGDEFLAAVAEMRSGATTTEALENLGKRFPDPSMTRLVDAAITAIERGAPLADALRAQADDSREARRRRLLEMGGRREVLMLIPVVFLIMPVVVVFALLPGLASLKLLVP